MDDETYARIRAGLPTHDRYTFPEVLTLIEREGIATDGDVRYEHPRTYVLWQGLSMQAAEILGRLMEDSAVQKDFGPKVYMLYAMEGQLINLPQASLDRFPEPYVSGERWLPVALSREPDAS